MSENAGDATTRHASGPAGTHPARIGPFRILGLIGEGAMGIVYEAEQERPHRRVALKIVRPGIVPAGVLRRFELESEFLGRLQHPGIAQIYQAGVEETASGSQPYFAMEFIRGRRLDEYVRVKAQSLRERLLLIAAIADAVQHAHHRGIIHRDLKPANIYVTEAGEPKILDFGVARAAHDNLLGTLQTVTGEVLGTISYMSPEQIAGDISALDTRSDVYALGVILYEVVAGRPPYDVDRKSFVEAARIIHEEEPTRLRSATRAAVPADVETIVTKALEKDKERRYSSAAELADDIRRFLRDEPIAARPPSATYQVQKFARRHKAIVAGVLASFIILLVGVVATSSQARVARARAHEADVERAKAEAVTGFLTEMLESIDPSQAKGRDVSVREALDAAAARIDSGAARQPAVEVAVRNVIGTTYGSLGLFEPAERQLRAAIAAGSRAAVNPIAHAESHARLVNVLYEAGKYADAEPVARDAVRLRRDALGPGHPDIASSLDDLGAVLMAAGNSAAAEPLMREALAMKRTRLAPDDPKIAVALNNLAFLTWRKGNPQEAESMYREALAIDRRRLGTEHPEIATKLINIAVMLRDQSRPDAAEPLVREAIAMQRNLLGDQHPTLANSLDVLAGTFEDRGDNAQAAALMREALAIATAADVALDAARLRSNLGWVLWKDGRYAEAEPLLRAAAEMIPKTYGPTHRNTRLALSHLAHDLNSLGHTAAAESTARQALALYRPATADRAIVSALVALSHALIAERRQEEAVPHLREALAIAETQVPTRLLWLKGEVQSTLGSVIASQGRGAEAETLLLAGHESLRGLPSTPPPRLRAALERLVTFYGANGKPAEAATWRGRLQAFDTSRGAAKHLK